MKEIIFLLLLPLGSSTLGPTTPGKPWATPADIEIQGEHLDLTSPLAEADILGNLMTSPRASVSGTQTATARTSEQHLAKATPAPSKEIQGLQTPPRGTQEKKTSTPASQSSASNNRNHANAKPEVLSNSGRVLPHNIPKKEPPASQVSKSQPGATGSRSSWQSYYSSNSTKQNTDSRKPSFETTRGKNWCAYVHTRLSPIVVVDNVQSYASGRARQCPWTTGGCNVRSQTVTQQAYRIKHKIVTSLEWKCCPGYSGHQCLPKDQQQQLLIHSDQAESNTAVSGGMPGNQQEDLNDQVIQKMNEQISSQEMKLTFLQKKVDNISAAMSDVNKTISSLEGKINQDKGRDFQSFLKGLKAKSITELVKDIVREKFKVFKSDMQETVAQIFQTVSSLSEDLESTKELVKHVNETQQKFAAEKETLPTRSEILELRNHVVDMETRMDFECGQAIKELQAKQKSLENDLVHERSKSSIYYESLNKSLIQIKEVHEELLSAERVSSQNVLLPDKAVNDNITEYMMTLNEKVKTQSLMVLQLYDDLRIQDSKISNLTVTLEIQRDSIHGECEDMLSKCKKDFQTQLKSTKENMYVLNKTMSDLVLPLDNKMDKMNEQINDLCYDMDILQPLIEQGPPFSLTPEYEQQLDMESIGRKLENLTSVVNSLSSVTEELAKSQEGLKSEARTRDEVFENRINQCFLDMEDGLNKTMIVMNNAIDSVQDNYVQKEMLSILRNENETHCRGAEKLDIILEFLPEFQKLNESLRTLCSDKQKLNYASKETQVPSDRSYKEAEERNLHDFRNIYLILNETLLRSNEHQQNISSIGEKLSHTAEGWKDCEVRLQSVESKITKFLANNCLSIKQAKTEKEQMVSLQLQTLSSRIRALEAKSIRVSISIPLLNKTAYEARQLSQDVFRRIQELNASIPQLIKVAHPDRSLLQRGLLELTESMLEIKTEAIRSNLTWYVNKSLIDALRIQKQTKQVVKKPAPAKKVAQNVTINMAGRSQRNTDNTIDAGEFLSCTSSPCLNGGTCINERKSFICACRHPFGGANCSMKMTDESALSVDFSKGSYRYAPMVAFFASHTYGMNTPGPIRFNNLDVNYGSSYVPASGKFRVPYLGVYVFEYTIESYSPLISGYLVVDGIDKLAFHSENNSGNKRSDRVISGDALLELNYGQEVWLRLTAGSIPAKYPPVTTFTGYLLYRT
uniref:Multimerin 1 n=1 Tax=Sphenodon punctatus TaxID=8508 RepID=A0A8D0GQ34_SPHPU